MLYDGGSSSSIKDYPVKPSALCPSADYAGRLSALNDGMAGPERGAGRGVRFGRHGSLHAEMARSAEGAEPGKPAHWPGLQR
jgi:hypothetical protein